jgi:DNA invertase Pin-like site-specific DNA recombinase
MTTRERAGRWLRVSTNSQDEANQERDIDDWIAGHSYQLVDGCTYRLRKSAYKGKHAEMLEKVIADMQDGKITVLVVWQSSRIERRGASSVFDLAAKVQKAGGRIEYCAPSDQYLNTSNEMSDVMLALAATRDNKESQIKSERVRIAQDVIRGNRGVLGRLPYGYRAEGDKKSKRPGCGGILEKMHGLVSGDDVNDVFARADSRRDIVIDNNAEAVAEHCAHLGTVFGREPRSAHLRRHGLITEERPRRRDVASHPVAAPRMHDDVRRERNAF